MKPIANIFILFFIFVVLFVLYKTFENKLKKDEETDAYKSIQKYLLNEDSLGKSKKPILWVHVPYQYNSRHWLSFGSRSSLELNQPYLYLTVRSIIANCDEEFTICIIDDTSFQKLIPTWNINMTTVSGTILSNMRILGMMKLLHMYGGLICPISFVCFKSLLEMYEKGTQQENKMFVCETINRNSTSSEVDFYPSLTFCGAPKNCETVKQLCSFIQNTTSHDYTSETLFLGEYDKWCKQHIENGLITLIPGTKVGTRSVEDKQIVIDDLMSNNYLELDKTAYGILIPADEILKRRKFEWFARMSEKQVLESDTIIGNYLLLANTSTTVNMSKNIAETIENDNKSLNNLNKKVENKFVGFWKTPFKDIYGLQPNYLGNHLQKLEYPIS